MQRWIGWFVIALCGVAYAQEASDDANQKILRALRTFNKAQVLYGIYGKGFACRLEQLGPPQSGATPSPQAAGLIDEELASGKFAGYQIQLNCTPDDYQVIAVPASDGAGAVWCVDKSAVLRTAETAGTCIAEGKVPPRRRNRDQTARSRLNPLVPNATATLDPSRPPHLEFESAVLLLKRGAVLAVSGTLQRRVETRTFEVDGETCGLLSRRFTTAPRWRTPRNCRSGLPLASRLCTPFHPT